MQLAPLAAIVLCFPAICSANDGVDRMFLTNDVVAMFFGVLNLTFSWSVVNDIRIYGQKAWWWLAGWCLLQQSAKILCSRSPVKLILVLCFVAMQPMELHIHILALMNNAPSLASADDDITALIICKILSTAPLLIGMSSVPAMNMWPPALLWALGSDRYDALLCIVSLILLAW